MPYKLNEIIEKIRGKRTQEDFAEEFNVTPRTLIKYEKGTAFPKYEFLKRLVDEYGVEPREIFGLGKTNGNGFHWLHEEGHKQSIIRLAELIHGLQKLDETKKTIEGIIAEYQRINKRKPDG